MFRITTALAIIALTSSAAAAPVLEIDGLFGECRPVLAAMVDSLTVHVSPSRSTDTRVFPYRVGWKVPYSNREGKTLVHRLGSIRVKKSGGEFVCEDSESTVAEQLQAGDLIEYLYYLGEGYARVRIDDEICDSFVDDSSEYLEVVIQPEVEAWIRVRFADGSSPGWLIFGGPQTRVARVEC